MRLFTTLSGIGVAALIVAWIAAARSARGWISLRMQAEKARLSQLTALTREKNEFLATISHSLKTPLGHILGFAELLNDGRVGALSPKQREFVQDIYNAGCGELEIVNSLIELAEIQASRTHLAPTVQNPRALVEAVANSFKERTTAGGLRLAVSVDEEVGDCWLDERAISRVLGVMLDNACRFTASGGKITVTARRAKQAGSANRGNAATSDFLEIGVQDSGCGMPPRGSATIVPAVPAGRWPLGPQPSGVGDWAYAGERAH